MRTVSFTIILALALIMTSFVGVIAYYTYRPSDEAIKRLSDEDQKNLIAQSLSRSVAPSRPVITNTDPLRGNPTAPITIVEFGDFQCAACAEVEPALLSVLEQNKDKVKLVWKDLPNTRVHPLAQRAAESARCAEEQGKFWEYHDRLLENQAILTETSFIQFARELGLNGDQFQECLQSGRAAELVTRSFNEALLLRVDATPYFFIDERRISGAVSEEELTAIIETTLKSLAL